MGTIPLQGGVLPLASVLCLTLALAVEEERATAEVNSVNGCEK